ncbi:MAG TPA: tetratricopeptide repeat protein [Flavobacteriaceae bacterium]|nr:tetratricopeptide repeat protein [Flavobacteriaceae bacterium]
MKFLYILLCFPTILFGQAKFEAIKQLFAQKQFEKAQEMMLQYVASNPNDIRGLELLGDAYSNQKKWDDAQNCYKKLTKLAPNNANYYYKYGGALGMKALNVSKLNALTIIGDVKSSFLKAAELDPKHIDVRWALVELYMQLPGILGGGRTKSFKYADELERLSKVDGYLAKAFIYESDGQPDRAEDYYEKAIKVGGSLTCYNKLTTFYEKQKQPEKAIANLEATKLKYDHNILNYEVGKLVAEYNVELDKGERYLLVYLENYSGNEASPKAWAHYRLAQIFKHKKEKDKALKYINLALSELPNLKPFEEEKETILGL